MMGFFDVPWPARRSLVILGVTSYLYGIAMMHHYVGFSIWIQGELADLLLAAEGTPPAPWIVFWTEGQAQGARAIRVVHEREVIAEQGPNESTRGASATESMPEPRRGYIGSSASNSSSDLTSQAAVFLEASQALRVCEDVKPEEVTYSLVTQCSDDRIWMMQHHCQRWCSNNSKPFISLVVYTNQTIEEIKAKLVELGCPVDNGLTVQTFPKTYADKEYPVNYFRNEALAAVTTTHAVFLDVDFWPSSDLFSTLNEMPIRSKLAESALHAMNVPAFELMPQCPERPVDCPWIHVKRMPSVKDDMMQTYLESGNITAFNYYQNIDGHGSTRYDWWDDQATSSTLREIECVKSNRYEPYLVVRVCRDLPPFQPVFTGYGKNKITWILHLRQLGYRLFQMGQAFVIHYPHKESKAKKSWLGGASVRRVKLEGQKAMDFQSKRSENDKYFLEFRQWLAESVPDRTRLRKCSDEGGFSQDDDTALWVARDDNNNETVAF